MTRTVPIVAIFLTLAACQQGAQRVEEVHPFGAVEEAPSPEDWELIGASAEGRPIQAATFGDGPRRVYLIAGIHGDERPGIENAERLRRLLRDDTELSGVVVRLVRDANPDGTERRSRPNARGIDLNRNWPARNFQPNGSRGRAPLSELETAAVHSDLVAFGAELVIVFHAARAGPFVNYDGPAAEQAELFASRAARSDSDWHVQADVGYPTPGSLGSLVGRDWGRPILTIEFRRGRDADSVWPALRDGLLAVLLSSPGGAVGASVR